MAISLERIKKYRRWLLWSFVASLLLPVLFQVFIGEVRITRGRGQLESRTPSGSESSKSSESSKEIRRDPAEKEKRGPPKTPEPQSDAGMLVGIGSLLTSTTTLIGFLVTTLFTWRKERRENDHAVLELEKKKLELEKLRGEISDKNAAAQDKRKKMTKRRRVV